MGFVCIDGQFYKDQEPVLTLQNSSFRYGDGFFETIKICSGTIPLWHYHQKRIEQSLKLLQLSEKDRLLPEIEVIKELCKRNNCLELGRIRIAFFRAGQSYGYAMEAWPLDPEVNQLNKTGFTLDIFPLARKSTDAYSNLKSANFLPYILGSHFAKERHVDDCLILNSLHLIADSTRANVFIIKNGELHTPGLHQGCVNGVMRRYLIENSKALGLVVWQNQLSEKDVLEADEVFLTNAIFGLRWVGSFREKNYRSDLTSTIHEKLLATIFG